MAHHKYDLNIIEGVTRKFEIEEADYFADKLTEK